MTDTEKAALEARIDELCAELATTQLNRDMWLVRAKVTLNSLSAAQAENAKLRWLAKDMRACFGIGAERDGVSKQWCYELFVSYTDKLRELGVAE